ncbi:MAG: DUF916 domain-containing protein [Chloroflexi bacterium]|nr:DUF916 domain-containing protein [Chloroflexota bacterium]
MTHLRTAGISAMIIVVMLLGALGGGTHAGAQGSVQFSIQPDRDTGQEDAYFTYTAKAGDTISDEALVISTGSEAVTLKLYAADAITAIGGGTAFAGLDEDRTGVRAWVRSSLAEVSLTPGGRQTVPFTVVVPADAAPGDHIAGLVVEAPPKQGQSGGVQTSVTERVGVAVVVRIAGEAREELALGGICLNQETGSNYFQVPVANNGNILSRPSGEFILQRQGGSEVFRKPIVPATILPQDATFLRIDAPADPGEGRYTAIVHLNQTDGRVAEESSDIRIRDEKVNGCQATDAIPAATAVVLGENVVRDEGDGGGLPLLTLSLIGIVVLLALLLIASEILRRRRRSIAR